MEKLYTVALVGADHLPAPRRIALETRFAQELEGILGSSKQVKVHLVARTVIECGDAGANGAHSLRLERAIHSARPAVWASLGCEQGADFQLHAD